MEYKFKLSSDEIKLLDVWKRSIKSKHGKYGLFTYTFTPYGMGTGVTVYSHLTDTKINLTDVSKW
jgi:hypothetical protein